MVFLQLRPLLIVAAVLSAARAEAASVSVSSSATTVVASPSQISALLYKVRVLAVRLADDDGGHASPQTQADFQAALDSANEIFARSGSRVSLSIDPASDFSGHVKSTLMNHDCKPLKTDAELAQLTDPKLDTATICDKELVGKARTAYALKYPDKAVVFLRYSKSRVRFDETLGHWVQDFVKATGGFSGGAGYVIVLVRSVKGGTFAAHEFGHYFHSPHTFPGKLKEPLGDLPTTLDEAKAKLTGYVQSKLGTSGFDPQKDGLKPYDADRGSEVNDTPPDAGTAIFKAEYGDPCLPDKGKIEIPIKVNGVSYTYTLAPMRDNVMSYFKGCPFDMRLSPNQVARHHASFQDNRKALLRPDLVSCYNANGIRNILRGATYDDLIEYRLSIIDYCLNSAVARAPSSSLTVIRQRLSVRPVAPLVAVPECLYTH